MSEIHFFVEEASEGGYIARAVNEGIFTEADDIAMLHANIRDVVHCHINESSVPGVIHLHFTREEVIAA